jgi:histone-binding protein RBBP4
VCLCLSLESRLIAPSLTCVDVVVAMVVVGTSSSSLCRYDTVMTHSLEWPSLTCQWLPTTKKSGSNASELSLLLGTHTEGEQNYLMVASTVVPTNDPVIPPSDKTNTTTSTNNTNGTTNLTTTTTAPPVVAYDEEKKEVGGFGHSTTTATSSSTNNTNTIGKVDYKMKIQHEGEVNRARYMPQNHFIVATRGPDSLVYIFDRSKHPSFPEPNTVFSPQMVCCGHTQEGYGLSWSKLKEGYLLSGSQDQTVCLWDIQATGTSSTTSTTTTAAGRQIDPIAIFKGHTAVVEDIDWHPKDPNMIVSVSDDRTIRLWDIRDGATKGHSHIVENAHTGDINGVAFNPVMEYTLATASADTTVAIWDLRNLQSKVHTLRGHTDEVYMVDWAPFNESILGSCSADRRVAIWDLSRTGQEQTEEDAEDGPPELLFLHGGHTAKVSDFSWNAQHPWVIASVSEDNVLQVWQCAEEIYAAEDDDDDDDDDDGENGDKLLGDDDLE